MLDTIALSLKPYEFKIMNHDNFNPSSRGMLEPPFDKLRRGGYICINNPKKDDIASYGYMPRLTLSKRPAKYGFNIALRVELSLPKLKFGNNFDELTDGNLPFLCYRLAEQMQRMGVIVKPETLQKAEVSAIHYSKNLPLTDYTSCSMVIREIAKGSITKRLDGVKTDYRNDGTAVKYHANSYEIILYDKLKDLERGKISKKRSIEGDGSTQLSLLTNPLKKELEVLRLEVRLGTRQKIRSLLKTIDKERPLTFESLYSSELAKTVLLHYWKMIIPDMALIVCSGFPSGELYDAIYNNDPKAKPSQVMQTVGALAIIQNDGFEGLRTRVERHSTSHSWYNMKKKLNGLSVTSHMRYNPVRIAQQHLEDFLPLKLQDYKKE